MISVAAIDCADEKNMPICREYEVMGYPSIKFFPPKSSPKELGAQREGHIKTVDRIKEDMHAYVVKLMQNESLHEHTKLWPDLESFK